MCQCTPTIRTPFCGKPGCEWPKETEPMVGAAGVDPNWTAEEWAAVLKNALDERDEARRKNANLVAENLRLVVEMDDLRHELEEARQERSAISARLSHYEAADRPKLALWEERARKLGRELEQANAMKKELLAACLRVNDQLCDWQTRAIEAERKLKARE